ncbi:lipid kinase [Halopseudomonas sabulinigri]|uniref:Lipid kinase n=1 Tax=Halopseudomonas sabulinigri TaxID=472181 RepID=A0ABP9ZMA1_9GAMM
MKHALLIINPHSRNGQVEALDEAIEVLKASGMEVTVRESESEEHLASLIEQYDRDDGVVVIGGGDGTLSSALDVLYRCQRTVAIFPMGTANDFARSIGVPQDLAGAARVIVEGKRKRVSLGKIENEHLFINVAHVGLGVDVTHELSSDSKKFFGVFAYLGAFLRAIKGNKSFKLRIQAEDWDCSMKVIHLAVGNGRYYGGGNIVDERATLFDEEFNLFFIKPKPWWQLLLLGPTLRKGAFNTTEQHIVRNTARRFRVQTSHAKELEADGEFKTRTPAEFELIPEAIEAIVGDLPEPSTGAS